VVDAAPFQKGSQSRLSLRVTGIICKPEVRPFDAYLSGIPQVATLRQDDIGMGDSKYSKGDTSVPAFGGTSMSKLPNIEVKQADDAKVGTVLLNKKKDIKLESGVILVLKSL
jgi:hypothetical protein